MGVGKEKKRRKKEEGQCGAVSKLQMAFSQLVRRGRG